MDLSTAVANITGVLTKINALTSSYNEAVRLMDGLSGALAVMLEFVKNRINDGNPVDPTMFSHLMNTLKAIEDKIDEIHSTLRKKWMCIPYGKWSVWGLPFTQPCLGKVGSTKLIKSLTDLEGDLNGDIKFLELQMSANAVQSLSTLARVQTAISSVFRGKEDAREFWVSNFGSEFTVDQKDFAKSLLDVMRRYISTGIDADVSHSNEVCDYISADLAKGGWVDARVFALDIDSLSMKEWINQCIARKSRTVFLPGHSDSVSCICSKNGFMVSGSKDGTVKIFAIADNGMPLLRSTLVGHNDEITCVDIDFSIAIVVSGSKDGTVRVWSLFGGCKQVFAVKSAVTAVHCYDSGILYSCESPSMSIYSRCANSGEINTTMFGHSGGVYGIETHSDSILSVGADRAIKKWSYSGDLVDTIHQAHSTCIKALCTAEKWIATVSNDDILFADPVKLTHKHRKIPVHSKFRGEVKAACPAGDSLVIATMEKFSHSANARLQSFNSRAVVSHDLQIFTVPNEEPESITSFKDNVYLGMSSGTILWLKFDGTKKSSKFVIRGKIATANSGTSPLLNECKSIPVLALRNDDAAFAMSNSPNLHIVSTDKTVSFKDSITAISPVNDDKWMVAHGQKITVVEDSGNVVDTYDIGGDVVSLQPSTVRNRTFADVRKKPLVRTLSVVDADGGLIRDVVSEPCPVSSSCKPALVLGDKYLIWPGYFKGTLSVLDVDEMRVLEPVKYTDVEVDPVTYIASSQTWFVTLHGGLDLLLWKDMKKPTKRLRTFENPVNSIAIRGSEKLLVIGCSDGTVRTRSQEDDETVDSEIDVFHSVGDVAVAANDKRGYSVGIDGSLVKHD